MTVEGRASFNTCRKNTMIENSPNPCTLSRRKRFPAPFSRVICLWLYSWFRSHSNRDQCSFASSEAIDQLQSGCPSASKSSLSMFSSSSINQISRPSSSSLLHCSTRPRCWYRPIAGTECHSVHGKSNPSNPSISRDLPVHLFSEERSSVKSVLTILPLLPIDI